jgi:hypothetical protein
MGSLSDRCLLDSLQHVENDRSFTSINIEDEEVDSDTSHQRNYACLLG